MKSTKAADISVIAIKGTLGIIPFIGPLAAEVAGTLIPNQRIDRIEDFLHRLEDKVKDLDHEALRQKFMTIESADLLEDSLYQTARALTDERKDYIASLIKNSLTDEQLKHIEYKKLLLILGQLNDIEIIILKSRSMSQRHPEYMDFWERNRSVLVPSVAHNNSTQEEIDRSAISESYMNHLVELGLLKKRFARLKKGEIPEFDENTGTVKARSHDITLLGRLLLRTIDQGSDPRL